MCMNRLAAKKITVIGYLRELETAPLTARTGLFEELQMQELGTAAGVMERLFGSAVDELVILHRKYCIDGFSAHSV